MGASRDVRVEVGGSDDLDARALEALTLELEEELRALDVDAVEPATHEAPEGARGDAITLGVLLVKAGPTALRAVVGAVQGWLKRSQARSVRIKIGEDELEVTAYPPVTSNGW